MTGIEILDLIVIKSIRINFKVAVNQTKKAIEVTFAELDEQIIGKRWIDYNPDLVEFRNYRREAEV